jgi:hypothetical protein
MKRGTTLGLISATILGALCVLGFWGASSADQENSPPVNNAGAQRDEMIRELREIKALLKEQNTLFQKLLEPSSGKSGSKR